MDATEHLRRIIAAHRVVGTPAGRAANPRALRDLAEAIEAADRDMRESDAERAARAREEGLALLAAMDAESGPVPDDIKQEVANLPRSDDRPAGGAVDDPERPRPQWIAKDVLLERLRRAGAWDGQVELAPLRASIYVDESIRHGVLVARNDLTTRAILDHLAATVAGVAAVLEATGDDHPSSVLGYLFTPQPEWDGTHPVAWLAAGGDPEAVIAWIEAPR